MREWKDGRRRRPKPYHNSLTFASPNTQQFTRLYSIIYIRQFLTHVPQKQPKQSHLTSSHFIYPIIPYTTLPYFTVPYHTLPTPLTLAIPHHTTPTYHTPSRFHTCNYTLLSRSHLALPYTNIPTLHNYLHSITPP